jgi:hypothetical protein
MESVDMELSGLRSRFSTALGDEAGDNYTTVIRGYAVDRGPTREERSNRI